MDGSWMRNSTRRRTAFGVAALIAAILCVFPQYYLARVNIVPNESGAMLGGVLGQIGGTTALAELLGGSTQDIYLQVCRGHDVLDDVIARLHLVGRHGISSKRQAEVMLLHRTDIESIRGGIIEITMSDMDPAFAKEVVSVYSAAFRDRMTKLAKDQASMKRAILQARMTDAATRLAHAEAALDQYRTANKLPAPETELGSAVGELAGLQGQLDAEEVALQTAEQFATPGNMEVRSIQSEIAALQQQIVQARTAARGGSSDSAESLALREFAYQNLYRNVQYSTGLYEIYERYMESTGVEELSADINTQVIESPYVDPRLQINIWAAGLLAIIIFLAFCSEYYLQE